MEKQIKTFEIETLEQAEDIVALIKNNFEKEENDQECIVIKYKDTISVDDLLKSLGLLWNFEINSGHLI